MELAAGLAESRRDGHQRQAGRSRRHQDRRQPLGCSADDRAAQTGPAVLRCDALDVRHQQDPVAGGDAKQRDEADQGSNRQHSSGQEHSDDPSDEGEREIEQRQDGVPRGPERRCEEHSDTDQDQRAHHRDAPGCRHLALILAAVLDPVALREVDVLLNPLPHFLYEPVQVATGYVAGDCDPALDAFPHHDVRAAVFTDVRNRRKGNPGSRRGVDHGLPDRPDVVRPPALEPDDQRERDLVLPDRSNLHA